MELKKSRKSFTLAFKKSALRHFELSQNKSKTAKVFGITRSTLIGWEKIKDEINRQCLSQKKKICRSETKKKALFVASEKAVFEWIQNLRENKSIVTTTMVQQKMLSEVKNELNNQESDKNFQASYGWLKRFLLRNNLVIRHARGVGRSLPDNSYEIIKKFLSEIYQVIEKFELKPDQIIHFGETSFLLDSYESLAVHKQEPQETNVSSFEKVRMSCLIGATANGFKFPLVAVIPRMNQLLNAILPDDVLPVYEKKGTFTSKIITDYFIERVLKPYMIENQIDKALIVLDSAKCHQSLKTALEECGCEVVFIPPNMTSVLQPADVSWFKLLKLSYVKNWSDWFINEDKEITTFGTIAGPDYVKMLNWIQNSWKDLDKKELIESFKYCGYTSNNTQDYHEILKEILEKQKNPPSNSIEFRDEFNEINEEFNEVFITDDTEYFSDDSESDQDLVNFDHQVFN